MPLSPTQTSTSANQMMMMIPMLIRLGRVVQNTSLTQLICSPSGDLPLTVDWIKDGQLIYTHTWQQAASSSSGNILKHQLDLGPRYRVTTGERVQSRHTKIATFVHPNSNMNVISLDSELSISSLKRQDGGLYSCSARNAYGQAERKLSLLVQEPPEAPELIDITHISSRSIGLRWLAPYDGNSPILKYTIEFRKQHNRQQGECWTKFWINFCRLQRINTKLKKIIH